MIKSLTVTNYLGESIKLELRRPDLSGLIVQNIDGLGPAKANINSTELATADGAIYNSSRVGTRNVVMNLIFMPDGDVEDIRHITYKYFPLKKRLSLLVETDSRICETYGYVESNDPNIFSDQEATQISIICPDPYFYDTDITTTSFYSVDKIFEFAFSNESLSSPMIEFAETKMAFIESIFYEGEVETGVVMHMHVTGPITNDITIYNVRTREEMTIYVGKIEKVSGKAIGDKDEIIISTVVGQKGALLLRDGKYTNILNCLARGCDWFQLSKGENTFAYRSEGGEQNLQFEIQNKIVYEGV